MAKEVCRYFKGDRPCKYYWVDRSHDCSTCSHKSAIKEKILIIKLDALGDVIRATPLATGLKKRYPDSFITWLVGEGSYEILKSNPNIDNVLKYNPNSVIALQGQEFDILVNLDKDKHTASLATRLHAAEKKGYGLDENGFAFPMNKGAEYHYGICVDNWGKKTENKKPYQEMVFDMADIPYNREEYVVNLTSEAYDFASEFKREHNIRSSDIVVGLNTGCGPVYPHKKWTVENYAKLISILAKDVNTKIILFGAKSEIDINCYLEKLSDNVINTTCSTSMMQFAALVDVCSVLVTGDTVGMHLAIALKRPVVAMFGPTPANEIDMYGLGIKIVADVECINCYDQFPCTREPNCMETISPDEVLRAIRSLVKL